MATPTGNIQTSSTSVNDEALEKYCIVWLDTFDNNQGTRESERTLRSTLDCIIKFQDAKQCQKYIEERLQTNLFFIIASGRLGKELLQHVHQFREILAVYIHCMDVATHVNWTRTYEKVKVVVNDLRTIVNRLRYDIRSGRSMREQLNFSLSNTTMNAGNSTCKVDALLIFHQTLFDCILRLEPTDKDKCELFSYLEKRYKNNESELNNIKLFKDNYSPNQVLNWYTRNSFFYKILNEILRHQNIHLIVLFREYIRDIYRQLKVNKMQSPVLAYRGQLISKDELKRIRNNGRSLISINSFFSTSTRRENAYQFIASSTETNENQPVLFEIRADPKMAISKPFADISMYSEYQEEMEVLFMLGTMFRVENIYRNEQHYYTLIVFLCDDTDSDFKSVLTLMKQKIGTGSTNFRMLGNILWEMGKFDLAEKYCERFLNELPEQSHLRYELCQDLSQIASQMGNYEKSFYWKRKMVDMNIESDTRHKPTVSFRWENHGVTVAGGHGQGNALNQFYWPHGLYVTENQSILISDFGNDRIVRWKIGDKLGEVIAGGCGQGSRVNQLNGPTNVIVDKKTNNLIICDRENQRIVSWSQEKGTSTGNVIASNVACSRIAMDNKRRIYVSNIDRDIVIQYRIGESQGKTVAGCDRHGSGLRELNFPSYIYVDQDESIYVSDSGNHRVMKWFKGAKEGIIVAGGRGEGKGLDQLCSPRGIAVDSAGTIFIADSGNDRVVCWKIHATRGEIVVGGNGKGNKSNQLSSPEDIAFDQDNNLYVSDSENNRIQRFSVKIG